MQLSDVDDVLFSILISEPGGREVKSQWAMAQW